MTFATLVGTLLLGAVVIAAVRQQRARRSAGRPLELRVDKPAPPTQKG